MTDDKTHPDGKPMTLLEQKLERVIERHGDGSAYVQMIRDPHHHSRACCARC